jgi:hypothetical protein
VITPVTEIPLVKQQGGQGKYSHVSLLLTLLPTNVANVNEHLSSMLKQIINLFFKVSFFQLDVSFWRA